MHHVLTQHGFALFASQKALRYLFRGCDCPGWEPTTMFLGWLPGMQNYAARSPSVEEMTMNPPSSLAVLPAIVGHWTMTLRGTVDARIEPWRDPR